MDPQENDTELIDVPLDESSFGGEEGTKPEIAATSKVERLIQWAVVFAIFVFLFWLLGTPLLEVFQHTQSVHGWMGVSVLSTLLVTVIGASFLFISLTKSSVILGGGNISFPGHLKSDPRETPLNKTNAG